MMTTVGLLCLCSAAVPLQAAESVTVTIDTEQQGLPISPFIYGQFIEHLGRCIYGGIWAEMLEIRNAGKKALLIGTVSLMPSDNIRGMHADILTLLKQLNASMYR
jgi:alpha-L-arabinofuranosidase